MTTKFIKIAALCSGLLSLGFLAACNQPAPTAKSEGAPMPTPTVSTNTVDMLTSTQPSTLSMINAIVKKPIDTRPTSGYLTIENGGSTKETITAVSSPYFGRVELHDHVKQGDMVSMVKLNTVDVPANGQVVFEQGGKHIMLFDAVRDLSNGDSVKVTLTFSNSGPIETNFVVLDEIPRAGGMMDKMPGHSIGAPDAK